MNLDRAESIVLGRKMLLSALIVAAGIISPIALDLNPPSVDAAPLGASDSKQCRKLLKEYAKKPKPKTLEKIEKNNCGDPGVSVNGAVTTTVTAGVGFTVNSQEDDRDRDPGNGICETGKGSNHCTLRAAIMETNARSGQDTINLPSGTYQLSNTGRDESKSEDGDLNIKDHLIIIGAGSGSTMVDGVGADRVFDIRGKVNVKLVGMTIANGRVLNGDGAGIRSDGDLTLEDVIVRNNTTDDGEGGGISTEGPLKMSRSTVVQNSASTGPGGGISSSSSISMDQVVVQSNTAGQGDGGGLQSKNEQQLTITNSTFESNSATSRDGGGIEANGSVSISSSTFNNNSAGRDGGGIHLAGDKSADLRNVTIVSNRASSHGGGISSDNNATITNATIVSNTANSDGGGIYRSNGSVNLTNTIIANNTSNNTNSSTIYNTTYYTLGTSANCSGGNISANSIIDSGTSCGFGSNSLTNTDPRLGSLASNGGATQTMAPQSGSPAIDAARGSCPSQDQRGQNRPVDGNGDGNSVCDIGAVEVTNGTSSTVVTTTTSGTPGANCNQFSSQANAQAFLRSQQPNDTLLIDNNRNGIACEPGDGATSMNPPYDYVPVQRSFTTTTITPGAYCSNFVSHASAQAYLRANPSDPQLIDSNRNGIACEGGDGAGFVSPPYDYNQVPR